MKRLTIVSGGERVGKSLASGPALRVNGDRPRGVIRRSGCRLTEFCRAVDWGFVAFALAWAATGAVLLHIAFEGGL